MTFIQNRNAQNVLSTCFLLALGVFGVGIICSISKHLSLCCRKIKLMIKIHVVHIVDHVVPGAQDSGLLGAAGNLLGGAGQGGNHEPPSFDQKQTHNCSI